MSDKNNFFSDSNGSIFKQTFPKTTRHSVIKSDSLEVGHPRKIEAQIPRAAHRHGGSINPIIEGDEIVGFVYECACGEEAKIMFEYEQSLGRAAS